MKKNIKAIYMIELALLFLTIIFYMLTKVISSNLKSYLAITFLLIILTASMITFGRDENRDYYQNYIIRTIITILMISGISIYVLGILIGFTHGYRITMNSVLFSIIPLILITIISELIREILVKKSFSNKLAIIIITLLLASIQILVELNTGVLYTSYDKFVFISTVVIPIIAENLLCSYLVYRSNARSSILFKLVVELYMYIIPIVPNLGYYLYATVKIIVAFITFYVINKNLLQEENKSIVGKINRRIFTVPIVLVLIVLVALVAGIYRYKLIAVASNSMVSTFYRGDAVLIEYKKAEEIKVGDILAFYHGQIVVTHRVVGIKRVNDKLVFNTKGDANDSPDGYITKEEDVIGTVDYAIKYIGFPTVWINDMFRKG